MALTHVMGQNCLAMLLIAGTQHTSQISLSCHP